MGKKLIGHRANLNGMDGEFHLAYGVPFYKYALKDFHVHKDALLDWCEPWSDKKFSCTRFIDSDIKRRGIDPEGAEKHRMSIHLSERDLKYNAATRWLYDSIMEKVSIFTNTKVNTAFKMEDGWINYLLPQGWVFPHAHFRNHNTIFAAVFYLTAPPNSGNFIGFTHNYSISSMIDADDQFITYYPVEGEVVFCPSSVVHMVTPNRSDDARISIAINIARKAPETPSALFAGSGSRGIQLDPASKRAPENIAPVSSES